MDYHCRTDEEGLRLWEEARAQAAQPSIPTIDISNLPPEAKRLVWAHIQATDPLLAALLQTRPHRRDAQDVRCACADTTRCSG